MAETNTYNNNDVDATSSQPTTSPTSDQGVTPDPSASPQNEAPNWLPPSCKDNVDEDEWPDEEPYDDPAEPGEEVDNEEDYEGNIPPRPGLEEGEGNG